MATLRMLPAPPLAEKPSDQLLSHDGRSLACRVEGGEPGIACFPLGAAAPSLVRRDEEGERHRPLAWTTDGDLLFRVETGQAPGRVGALPAQGRGSPIDYRGSGIAVSADGRGLAVADPAAGELRVALAPGGNSPFHLAQKPIGRLSVADPADPVQLGFTRDTRFVLAVIRRAKSGPALWSFPCEGGEGQELAPALPAPGFLSFAVAKELLAVLEIREGDMPSTRLYVRPLASGSLGAVMLGPARDLLFVRQALPHQRPAFSADGKRIALLASTAAPLPGGGGEVERVLELLPSAGGYPQRAVAGSELRGSPHFLESGEVAIDGLDRVAVVTL